MKTLKTILILCFAICVATSCKKTVDMTLVQKTVFENADIRQINVDDAWPATIVYDSAQTFVELEYSAYLEPYIRVRMEDQNLEIGFTGKVYAEVGSVFRATIHTNRLEKLSIEEAAIVDCQQNAGVFSGRHLDIEISKASRCSSLAFSGESCEIRMEDASVLAGFRFAGNSCVAILEDVSQFNGELSVAESIEIQLSDASRFVGEGGITDRACIKMTEASLLNMAEIQVTSMEVELSEGSEATVHVTDLLSGSLKEASTLFYKGSPIVDVECLSGSSIIPF